MIGEIVVGVDESDGAAEALRWAVREASFHDSTVTAVMAWGLLDQHYATVAERFDPAYDESNALEALRTFIASAVGEQAAAEVRARAVCELPARALLDAATEADLLVVGARGLGGFRGLMLGSVSQRCLNDATVPVAIVRAVEHRNAQRTERIVVGVDGSETSQRALRWALAEGRGRKASVEVVHAWQIPYAGHYPHMTNMIDLSTYEEASRKVLDDALAAEGADDHAVPIKRTSIQGGAAATIVDLAEDADLVVLGSRGLGAVKKMLLGSVTMQVTHHSQCPVVVIPAAD